jgi:hypothetical protein
LKHDDASCDQSTYVWKHNVDCNIGRLKVIKVILPTASTPLKRGARWPKTTGAYRSHTAHNIRVQGIIRIRCFVEIGTQLHQLVAILC